MLQINVFSCLGALEVKVLIRRNIIYLRDCLNLNIIFSTLHHFSGFVSGEQSQDRPFRALLIYTVNKLIKTHTKSNFATLFSHCAHIE